MLLYDIQYISDILNIFPTCISFHNYDLNHVKQIPFQKNDPPHDKTNKIACALGLIRVFAVRVKKAWVISYPLSASEDSDQTGRMPRLIWVFAGRTCHFVGFVMRRLQYGRH